MSRKRLDPELHPLFLGHLTEQVMTLSQFSDFSSSKALTEKLIALFDQAPGFFAYLSGPNHVFEFINQGYTALVGQRDVLGKPFKEALADLDGQGYYETLDRVYASGEPFIGSGDMMMLERPDGTLSSCIIDFIYQPLRDEQGKVCGIICQGHDVTQRVSAEQARDAAQQGLQKALEAVKESEARFVELANNVEDVFYSWDAKTRKMLYVNSPCETIWGLSEADLQEHALTYLDRVVEEDRAAMHSAVEKLLAGGDTLDMTYRIKHANGYLAWVRERARAVFDEQGQAQRVVGTARDVTARERARQELRRKQKKLSHLASHDALTGLPNRAFLSSRMKRLLRGEKEQIFGILYIDIDHFKDINDTRGHGVGDELLKIIAERLCRCVSNNDFVVRMGGDEFVIVATNLREESNCALIAERVLSALGAPVRIDSDIFHITASVGMAVYPDDGEDLQTLLQHADIALYQIKDNGRNGYQVFGADMTAGLMQRTSLEKALRDAIEHKSIFIEYQPIVDLASGRILTFEALARWKHPDLGLVSPAEFIPLAEQNGMIRELGSDILCKVVRQISEWASAGLAPVPVNVNVSAKQFEKGYLKELIVSLINQYQINPSLLILEITESALMEKSDRYLSIMRDLRSLGVRIAIDDFGTGYSSLAYLKNFPLDALKIDKSFISEVGCGENDRAIVEMIVKLAQVLNLSTIAEGIETSEQLRRVQELGVTCGQGYLFSKPLSAAECTRAITARCCFNFDSLRKRVTLIEKPRSVTIEGIEHERPLELRA